jgi:hypothetical protein
VFVPAHAPPPPLWLPIKPSASVGVHQPPYRSLSFQVFEIANAWRTENGLAPIDVPSQSALDEAVASSEPITQLEGLGDQSEGEEEDDEHVKYADDDFDGDTPLVVEGEKDFHIQAINQAEGSQQAEGAVVEKGGEDADDDMGYEPATQAWNGATWACACVVFGVSVTWLPC